MSMRTVLTTMLCFVAVGSQLMAEDPVAPETRVETTEEQWDKAKATYREQLQKLGEEVLARIASLEKKARENGDLARVKEYKAMSDAFTDSGELPSVINKADYERKRKRVQDDLRREAKLVIAAYLKDKRDTDAEDINQELSELLAVEKASDASDSSLPPVPEDSRKRFVNLSYDNIIIHVRGKKWEQIDSKTKKHTWWLTETGRDDKYIYVHCADRKQDWRIGEKRMDLLQPNKSWVWLSNGYWDAGGDR
jgi:hypothetical protein